MLKSIGRLPKFFKFIYDNSDLESITLFDKMNDSNIEKTEIENDINNTVKDEKENEEKEENDHETEEKEDENLEIEKSLEREIKSKFKV